MDKCKLGTGLLKFNRNASALCTSVLVVYSVAFATGVFTNDTNVGYMCSAVMATTALISGSMTITNQKKLSKLN